MLDTVNMEPVLLLQVSSLGSLLQILQ